MNGKQSAGFTLMELLVVLLLISLLASIVAPIITKSIHRAKESTLKEDLFILRQAIDDYYADNGKYPIELEVLVAEKYVRKIPPDPIAGQEWNVIRVESEEGEQGIIDIQSRSDEQSAQGVRYNEW